MDKQYSELQLNVEIVRSSEEHADVTLKTRYCGNIFTVNKDLAIGATLETSNDFLKCSFTRS